MITKFVCRSFWGCRSGAYVSFMGLYASAPRMAPYLMDALLPRVRAQGLATLLAAHRPARLSLDWTMTQLGWEEDQEQEVGLLHAPLIC